MNILGIELDDIPDTQVVDGVILIAKTIDPDGNTHWHNRSSGINVFEQLGIYVAAADACRDRVEAADEDN